MIGILATHGGTLPDSIRRACWQRMRAQNWEMLVVVGPKNLQEAVMKHAAGHDYPVIYVPQECTRPGQADRWSRLHRGAFWIADNCPSSPAVCLLEHDVLYPPGYPESRNAIPGLATYAQALRLVPEGYGNAGMLSSTCCLNLRDLLAITKHRLWQIETGERIVWDEPGRCQGDPVDACRNLDECMAPVIDIRWGGNFTGARKATHHSSHSPPSWGTAADLWARIIPPPSTQPQINTDGGTAQPLDGHKSRANGDTQP